MIVPITIAVLLVQSPQTQKTALAEAQAQVNQGDFAGAAISYQTAIKAGASNADMYYNLGTAALKSGANGVAVYALERAHRLSPGDGDISYNLARALERVQGPLASSATQPRSDAFLLKMTLRQGQWSSLGLLLAALLASLVFVALRARLSRRPVVFAQVCLVLLWLVGCAMVATTAWRWQIADRGDAVIVSEQAINAHEAPGETAPVVFALHPGHPVQVVAQSSDYNRVRLSNGLEGWVKSGVIVRVEN